MRHQLGGKLEAALRLRPVLPRRGVSAQRENVADATVFGLVEDDFDLPLRVLDAGEMRHRGKAEVVLDLLNDLEGFLAGTAPAP